MVLVGSACEVCAQADGVGPMQRLTVVGNVLLCTADTLWGWAQGGSTMCCRCRGPHRCGMTTGQLRRRQRRQQQAALAATLRRRPASCCEVGHTHIVHHCHTFDRVWSFNKRYVRQCADTFALR